MKDSSKLNSSGILFAVVSASSFATLGIFTKLLYEQGMGVSLTLAWRFLITSIIVWSLLFILKKNKLTLRQFKQVLGLGVFGFSVQAGLFFITLSYLPVSLTSILLYLYPSFVVLGLWFFMHRKPTKLQFLALIFTLIGCGLTLQEGIWEFINQILNGEFNSSTKMQVGFVWGICTALFYATYLIISEKILAKNNPFTTTAGLSLGATLVFWSICFINGTAGFPPNLHAWWLLLCLAVFSTVVPILTLFASMQRIGVAQSCLISTIEPVVTVMLGALLLGEHLTFIQLLGGGIILLAVLLIRGQKYG